MDQEFNLGFMYVDHLSASIGFIQYVIVCTCKHGTPCRDVLTKNQILLSEEFKVFRVDLHIQESGSITSLWLSMHGMLFRILI